MMPEEAQTLLNLIDAGGTVAVLLLLLVGFVRGDIMSRATMVAIIHETVTEVLEVLKNP